VLERRLGPGDCSRTTPTRCDAAPQSPPRCTHASWCCSSVAKRWRYRASSARRRAGGGRGSPASSSCSTRSLSERSRTASHSDGLSRVRMDVASRNRRVAARWRSRTSSVR
jgi:hypothetical protein